MPVDIIKWQTHPYSYNVVSVHRLTLCQTPDKLLTATTHTTREAKIDLKSVYKSACLLNYT